MLLYCCTQSKSSHVLLITEYVIKKLSHSAHANYHLSTDCAEKAEFVSVLVLILGCGFLY